VPFSSCDNFEAISGARESYCFTGIDITSVKSEDIVARAASQAVSSITTRDDIVAGTASKYI